MLELIRYAGNVFGQRAHVGSIHYSLMGKLVRGEGTHYLLTIMLILNMFYWLEINLNNIWFVSNSDIPQEHLFHKLLNYEL